MVGEMRQNRWVNFFEGFIVVAILFALLQTFFEDFAIVAGWSWSTRRMLVYTGFGFDLLFTIEFLVRLFFALSRRHAFEYLVHERGWIDFLASIPLLLLNSGPEVLSLLGGVSLAGAVGGYTSMLSIVKAIRMARILRVLKLLRQIRNTESTTAQRHISKVSIIGVSVFVFVILGFGLLDAFIPLPTISDTYGQVPQRIISYVNAADLGAEGNEASLAQYAASEPMLLLVKSADSTRYSRFGNEYYATYFGPSDYIYLSSGKLGFYFDVRALNADQSLNNLVTFGAILLLVILMLLAYGTHFARTVTDPVHVMRRGMSEGAYNLEARIPVRYATDEIFQLAELYNSHYLPMKARSGLTEESSVLDVGTEDISDLIKG